MSMKKQIRIRRFVELDLFHVKIADIAIVLVFEVVIERCSRAFADVEVGYFQVCCLDGKSEISFSQIDLLSLAGLVSTCLRFAILD